GGDQQLPHGAGGGPAAHRVQRRLADPRLVLRERLRGRHRGGAHRARGRRPGLQHRQRARGGDHAGAGAPRRRAARGRPDRVPGEGAARGALPGAGDRQGAGAAELRAEGRPRPGAAQHPGLVHLHPGGPVVKIVVVGAGKMGLPLAAQFASRGATVTACDVSARVVAAINAGECPVDEPGVPALVAAAVAAGRLSASTDTTGAVAEADAVVVIVPALLTDAPDADLSILEAVTRQVAAALRPGMLVSYETTLPVGTTRGRFGPLLEAGSGLVAGRDFALVFSPERVKSQRVLLHLTETPKVVGGID